MDDLPINKARGITMNARSSRISLCIALAAGTLFFSAGMLAGKADGYAFMPPPGWQSLQKPGHGIGIWVHPGDTGFRQNVNVVAERYTGSLNRYTIMGIHSIKAVLLDVQIGTAQHATVCGSHPASYLTYAATVRSHRLIYEQMATLWNGVAYVATYTRESSQPSLPAARTALTSLCGGLPGTGGPAMTRSATPPLRAAATTTPSGYNPYPAPVGSVAPTITPRP